MGSHTPPEDRRARSSGAGCGYIRASREILPFYNSFHCTAMQCFFLFSPLSHSKIQLPALDKSIDFWYTDKDPDRCRNQ